MRNNVINIGQLTFAEVLEGERPPRERAQECLEVLLDALRGDRAVIPFTTISPARTLDPHHKGPIDMRNPPMVGSLRVSLQPPPQHDKSKTSPGGYEVYKEFHRLLEKEFEALKAGKSESQLLPILRGKGIGKFIFDQWVPATRGRSKKKTEECNVPKKGVR